MIFIKRTDGPSVNDHRSECVERFQIVDLCLRFLLISSFLLKSGSVNKMVAIRLMRLGAKKKPFYRIIVTDSRMPRESKAKEILGYYDPMKEPPDIKVDLERTKYWLEKGAQASNTVRSLLHKVSKLEKQPNNKT